MPCNVTKRYGDFTAVNDLTFDVQRGEIFSMLGPNGAGKTTTIRMILDILKPDTGHITLFAARSAIAQKAHWLYAEERGLYQRARDRRWAISANQGMSAHDA